MDSVSASVNMFGGCGCSVLALCSSWPLNLALVSTAHHSNISAPSSLPFGVQGSCKANATSANTHTNIASRFEHFAVDTEKHSAVVQKILNLNISFAFSAACCFFLFCTKRGLPVCTFNRRCSCLYLCLK